MHSVGSVENPYIAENIPHRFAKNEYNLVPGSILKSSIVVESGYTQVADGFNFGIINGSEFIWNSGGVNLDSSLRHMVGQATLWEPIVTLNENTTTIACEIINDNNVCTMAPYASAYAKIRYVKHLHM